MSAHSFASLSLDLDNQWSYLKTHGDDAWIELPTYLPRVVPRVLEYFRSRETRITFFVVGQDAVRPENADALGSIAAEGHEIGNHSFHHEPWLHRYTKAQIEDELRRAEEAIESVTGTIPRGFRGPGYSFSPTLLSVLTDLGYVYDASTFPTFLGPLARAYYFVTARLSAEQKRERARLFGRVSDGFRSLRPFIWPMNQSELVEIPVTTVPLLRIPFHLSYLLYLGQTSRRLALRYFRNAIRWCRFWNVEPSFLLHPLDFLGGDEVPGLGFFPGMKLSTAEKLSLSYQILDEFIGYHQVGTMMDHALRVRSQIAMSSRKNGPNLKEQTANAG